jgi:hypothetical protein
VQTGEVLFGALAQLVLDGETLFERSTGVVALTLDAAPLDGEREV